MTQKGILIESETPSYRKSLFTDKYKISNEALSCLIEMRTFKVKPVLNENKKLAADELVNTLAALMDKRIKSLKDVFNVKTNIKNLLEENTHLPIANNLLKYKNVESSDFIFLTQAVVTFIKTKEQMNLLDLCKSLYCNPQDADDYCELIKMGITWCNKCGYLDISNHMKSDEITITFTQKGFTEFLSETVPDIKKPEVRLEFLSEKKPGNIMPVELFFNNDLSQQIDNLTQLLKNESLTKAQNELEEQGLPKGITVLFEGAPGTGKTELAFQLARLTGRTILSVNSTELRDPYIGVSEKNFKRLFDSYKKAMSIYEELPIMLLNEADALISRRVNIRHSSDILMNSTQNIMLEELENFTGIMFATTNLKVNMDKAFDRRFLYKITITEPDADCMLKILRQKCTGVHDYILGEVASKYCLTGGQIRNVMIKVLLIRSIEMREPDYNEIIDLFNSEQTGSRNNPIGYKNNPNIVKQ